MRNSTSDPHRTFPAQLRVEVRLAFVEAHRMHDRPQLGVTRRELRHQRRRCARLIPVVPEQQPTEIASHTEAPETNGLNRNDTGGTNHSGRPKPGGQPLLRQSVDGLRYVHEMPIVARIWARHSVVRAGVTSGWAGAPWPGVPPDLRCF